MTIPIEIPGLDTIIPQIAQGRVIIVEGGADLTNTYFVRRLGLTALQRSLPVTFLTSKDPGEVSEALGAAHAPSNGHAQPVRIVGADSVKDLEQYVPPGGLLVVDSFSFLTLDLDPHELARLLRKLHTVSRQLGSVSALATDRGMFDPRAEAIAIHLADGYIQFHAKEGPEGLQRFLRIPKWTDGRFLDRNIYYDFDGRRLAIDLRQRVI